MRAGPAGGGQPRGFGRPFGRWPSATGCMRPSLPSLASGERLPPALLGLGPRPCGVPLPRGGRARQPLRSRAARHGRSPQASSRPRGGTCASVNSYRRLGRRPGPGVPRLGPGQPRGALRVPSTFGGREAERPTSSSRASPYLALGGVIAAGLDGLERPPPDVVDPSTLSEQKLERLGAVRLSQSLERHSRTSSVTTC